MKGIKAAVANALSFAHLAVLGRAGAPAAEGGVVPKDDGPQAPAAEGGVVPKDEGPQAPEASAEGGDERKRRDDESDEEYEARMKALDDKAVASGKGDKPGDGEDDDDKEMRGNSPAAQARRREQARCAAIFASPAAARNPVLAATLAFTMRMSRAEAVAVLESTPAPASVLHPQRAARNPQVGATGGAPPAPAVALASRWDANLKAALGPNKRAV